MTIINSKLNFTRNQKERKSERRGTSENKKQKKGVTVNIE